MQLGNSKVEAHFADVRSYMYQGKKVDQQVHLGFDLAVTQHTPVLAANDGKVLLGLRSGHLRQLHRDRSRLRRCNRFTATWPISQ